MSLKNSRSLIAVSALAILAGLLLGLHTTPTAAQSEPVTKEEFDILKDDLDQIKSELGAVRNELEAIRTLLSQRAGQPRAPAARSAKVSIDDDPVLGRADAPVTLLEFSDYQCPFCARFFRDTLPTLKAEYIDTGKVRYVFRDFPIDQLHPYARKAAEAANCAGDQGRYWEMHDLLFENQSAMQVERLKAYAKGLGDDIDMAAFDECLTSGKYSAEVQKDFQAGSAAGVRGTPGFFVGKAGPDGSFEGTFINGAQPYPVFRDAIERLLEEG